MLSTPDETFCHFVFDVMWYMFCAGKLPQAA